MLLAIAILAGIGYLCSILDYINRGQFNVSTFLAAILVISTWQSCLPFAIIVICITVLIGIVGAAINDKD